MIKLLVEVELRKPLMRGTKSKFKNELIWVHFKYEKLPVFCLYCGIRGHQEKSCERKLTYSKDSMINEGQYGEWMRVQGVTGGKRVGGVQTVIGKKAEIGKEMTNVGDLRKENEEAGNRKGGEGQDRSSINEKSERMKGNGKEQKKEEKL